MRKCYTCKCDLTVENSYKDGSSYSGRGSQCKACTKIRTKNYLDRDRKENFPKYLLKYAKRRAQLKGLDFNLTIEDIIIPDVCPVFGTVLELNNHTRQNLNTPTLDRIDNSKGYVKGNVIVVSWKANRIKNNASLEELQLLVNFYKNN